MLSKTTLSYCNKAILRSLSSKSCRFISSSVKTQITFQNFTPLICPKSIYSSSQRSLLYNQVRRYSVSAETLQHSDKSTDNESNSTSSSQPLPEKDKAIGWWLAVCSGMVFGIVVVGGITRLTESGLSITEWKPVTGIWPPTTAEQWEEQFKKYKEFPEFLRLQPKMTLEEYKSIYYWEWGHRVLGRLVGVAFALPLLYFVARRRIRGKQLIHYAGMFLLGGAQGAMGWYMVQSGLNVKDHEIPRVSPYRLCAHLGLAFLLYLGLLWGTMTAFRPLIHYPTGSSTQLVPKWLRPASLGVLGLTFTTAMSGAFVAGLDAGLCYNEFPYMGDGFVPDEYWRLRPYWKNFTENSAAVQFNHRVLGLTTFAAVNALWLCSIKHFSVLPKPTVSAIRSMAVMSWVQVGLGLTTLLYFVPIPLAAAHQAGSLTLLTFTTWLAHTLIKRKPAPFPKI